MGGSVQASGVRGILWLDGSFVTQKPSPSDIDCVMWGACWVMPSSATPANQLKVQSLFDHAAASTLYGLDFYLEIPTPDTVFHREAYWRGIFGFSHDRVTAKGFAEIQI